MRIAGGLGGWLAFEFKCGRGYLFSERYLAHAVGQLLRGAGEQVRSEVQHPRSEVLGGKGRPLLMDFEVSNNEGSGVLAVETKWAGTSAVRVEALLWDAVRLAEYHRAKGAPGVLVLAGIDRKVNALVSGARFLRQDSNGVPLFPLKGSDERHVLRWRDLHPDIQDYVREKREPMEDGQEGMSPLHVGIPQTNRQPGPTAVAFTVYAWAVRSHGK